MITYRRETDRQKPAKSERDREGDRLQEKGRQRQTDRHTHRDRETETERERDQLAERDHERKSHKWLNLIGMNIIGWKTTHNGHGCNPSVKLWPNGLASHKIRHNSLPTACHEKSRPRIELNRLLRSVIAIIAFPPYIYDRIKLIIYAIVCDITCDCLKC